MQNEFDGHSSLEAQRDIEEPGRRNEEEQDPGPAAGPAARWTECSGGGATGGPAACSSAVAKSSGSNASTTSCIADVNFPLRDGPDRRLTCQL